MFRTVIELIFEVRFQCCPSIIVSILFAGQYSLFCHLQLSKA
jgi:hypothetical protein